MSYVPNTEQNRKEMLEKIGVREFSELIGAIPDSVRLRDELKLPPSLSEMELTKLLGERANQSKDASQMICFLGGGAYDHFIPAIVDHIISRSEYYTAYTPYQAEVSQGTLQTIYEFQSLICELTGMDVANASMYDGASAAAEATLLAHAHTGRDEVLVAGSLNPNYRDVLNTYCGSIKIKVRSLPLVEGLVDVEETKKKLSDKVSCVIVQTPNFFGLLENVGEIEPLAHSVGALVILVCDPISLGILKTPGEFNADIAVGEGQALGTNLNLGGPYLGYFACRRSLIRRMPGRIVAATTDTRGKRGFVMTLQTREQHIRREKATSNICTNQALCALSACVYLSLMGKSGIRKVAKFCLQKSHYATEQISRIDGFKKRFDAPFFKEFVIETPFSPKRIVRSLLKRNIFAGIDLSRFDRKLKNHLLVCVTEKRTKEEIDHLVDELRKLTCFKGY
ncbi:MAG: glycine dehydrogenase [candidate division Zixibacteria bacterium SM23_73_3]|nr:MAG: glycine dehydrogenase [candidate division Zixibacteria bacterium SM23_73_3]